MKNKFLVFGLMAILTVVMSIGVFASTKGVSVADNADSEVKQSEEKDNEKEQDEDQDLTNVTVVVSEETAKQIAMDSVANGTFVKIELEDEDGIIVYGVELTLEGKEFDVKVDANSGQILNSDEDQDDENDKDSKDEDNDQIEHENDNEDQDGHED